MAKYDSYAILVIFGILPIFLKMVPAEQFLDWKGGFYCRGRAPKRVQPVKRPFRPEVAPACPGHAGIVVSEDLGC